MVVHDVRLGHDVDLPSERPGLGDGAVGPVSAGGRALVVGAVAVEVPVDRHLVGLRVAHERRERELGVRGAVVAAGAVTAQGTQGVVVGLPDVDVDRGCGVGEDVEGRRRRRRPGVAGCLVVRAEPHAGHHGTRRRVRRGPLPDRAVVHRVRELDILLVVDGGAVCRGTVTVPLQPEPAVVASGELAVVQHRGNRARGIAAGVADVVVPAGSRPDAHLATHADPFPPGAAVVHTHVVGCGNVRAEALGRVRRGGGGAGTEGNQRTGDGEDLVPRQGAESPEAGPHSQGQSEAPHHPTDPHAPYLPARPCVLPTAAAAAVGETPAGSRCGGRNNHNLMSAHVKSW